MNPLFQFRVPEYQDLGTGVACPPANVAVEGAAGTFYSSGALEETRSVFELEKRWRVRATASCRPPRVRV